MWTSVILKVINAEKLLNSGEVGGWETNKPWERQRNTKYWVRYSLQTVLYLCMLLCSEHDCINHSATFHQLSSLHDYECTINYTIYSLTHITQFITLCLNTCMYPLTSHREGERRNIEWKNTKICAWLLEITK